MYIYIDVFIYTDIHIYIYLYLSLYIYIKHATFAVSMRPVNQKVRASATNLGAHSTLDLACQLSSEEV